MKNFKKHRGDKGFTLVELIVVLVILAILAALLVPALTGYIDAAREKALIAEARAAVVAAQTTASELYGKGTLTEAELKNHYKDICTLAEVNGSIEDITIAENSAEITQLVYKAANGKYVLYKDKTYTISDESPIANQAKGYQKVSEDLLDAAIAAAKINNTKVWNELRNAFAAESNGNLSATEQSYLSKKGLAGTTLSTLKWKPTILVSNDVTSVMLIASNSSSANNAYLIYYNGDYYYHTNGYTNTPDTANVSDQGSFDLTLLDNTAKDGWHKLTT